MTNVQPIRETVQGALRNAVMIAESHAHNLTYGVGHPTRADDDPIIGAFQALARLIRLALEDLGEPNLAAVQAAEILVREYHGSLDDQRNARDVAAGILRAAVTGEVPKTWEAP